VKKTLLILLFIVFTLPAFCLEEKLWFSSGGGIKLMKNGVAYPLVIEMNWLSKMDLIFALEAGYEISPPMKLVENVIPESDRFITGIGIKYQFGQPGGKFSFSGNAGIKTGFQFYQAHNFYMINYADLCGEINFWVNRFFGTGIQAGWNWASDELNMDTADYGGPYIRVYFLFDWWQNMTKTVRGGWEF